MDELKNIGPELKKISKEMPFKIPDRYFESFTDRLNDRIHKETRTYVPVKQLYSWKPYVAAAAIVVFALIAGNYFHNHHAYNRAADRFSQEISQVIEQDLYSISEETILEAMEMETIDTTVDSSLETKEMIDYLMNESLIDEKMINAL